MKEEKEDYREDTPDATFSEEDSEIIIFDLGDSEDAGRQVQAEISEQPDKVKSKHEYWRNGVNISKKILIRESVEEEENFVPGNTTGIEALFFGQFQENQVTQNDEVIPGTDDTETEITEESVETELTEHEPVKTEFAENDDQSEKNVQKTEKKPDNLEDIFFGLAAYEETSISETIASDMDASEADTGNKSETTIQNTLLQETGVPYTAANELPEDSEPLVLVESEESLEEEKWAEKPDGQSEKGEIVRDEFPVKVMSFVLSLILALLLVYLAHGTMMKQMIFSQQLETTVFVFMVLEVLLLIDAGILMFYHKKWFLLPSALFCMPVYLYLRRKVRKRSFVIVHAWLLLFVIFLTGMIWNVRGLWEKTQCYDVRYRQTMLRFELNHEKTEHCVDTIIGQHMKNYTYEVTGTDQNGLLEVKVAGNSNTIITDIVKPDKTISPNTELYFKIKKNGVYYLTGLKINRQVYNAFADTVWEHWTK